MTSSSSGTDQSRILDFLARVDRRLRVQEALGALTLGLWGLSGVLLVTKLAGLWERTPIRSLVLLIYGVAVAALVAWSYRRRKGLSAPAGIADLRSDAKDALKSALVFIGLPERTRWMNFQIHRTAALADGLSPSEVTPTTLPRPLLYSSGLAFVLAALLSWNPRWLQEVDATSWLSSVVQENEAAEGTEEERAELVAEDPEKLSELETAVERLRELELDSPEMLRDLEQAREALAASRLDMEELEAELERMGAELEAAPGLQDLAEALKSHDAEKAAELLRELAKRLSEAKTSEELASLLESLQKANVQQQDLAELLERLEKAQGNLSAEALAEMAQALEQAADQLEAMGDQMTEPLEAMGEEMQSLQASLGQQQQAPGQAQEGQQQQSGGQATQSASGMMSSQLQMAQFQGDPSNAVPMDAGPAGDATGPGGGQEPVLGEATTLDVQLEMEVLQTEKRDEPVPEEIFERLSREEKSTLNYEAVTRRGSFAEEDVLSREKVPWPYRSLVRRYFLSMVENSESKSESGSEK
jgi:hypothetical protein